MIPTKPGENHLRPVVDPNCLHLIGSVITPDAPARRNDYTPIANTQSARHSHLINGLITGRNAIRRRRLPGLVVT
jgi:hypothetical protein